MSKVRTYDKETVEICRNCHGGGIVVDEAGREIECPVCDGSGMVIRQLDITITITPFKTSAKRP